MNLPSPNLHQITRKDLRTNIKTGRWFYVVILLEPELQLCSLYIFARYFKTYAYGELNLRADYSLQNLQLRAENGW